MRVLELEVQRAPFHVRERELSLPGTFGDWTLTCALTASMNFRMARRLLIDYKSGAPERCKLDDVNARPIQLAAYVAALAGTGFRRRRRGAVVTFPEGKGISASPAGPGMRHGLPGKIREQTGVGRS